HLLPGEMYLNIAAKLSTLAKLPRSVGTGAGCSKATRHHGSSASKRELAAISLRLVVAAERQGPQPGLKAARLALEAIHDTKPDERFGRVASRPFAAAAPARHTGPGMAKPRIRSSTSCARGSIDLPTIEPDFSTGLHLDCARVLAVP